MSSSDKGALHERVLPARGAAKRASKSFAEQLMSSPTRSDDDHSDHNGPSNPFGEPSSHRAKNIKYRYSATGKHLSSPLRGRDSSSPERKGKKSKPKPKTKPLPTPSSSYLTTKTSETSVSRKRKASLSPALGDGTLSSLSALSPSPLSSVPTSPGVVTKDLPSTSIRTTKEITPELPVRIRRSKTLSLPSFNFSGSSSSLPRPLSSSQKKVDKAKVNRNSDPWDVGRCVWVLVNESGVLARNSAGDRRDEDDECVELMWWPTQIVQKEPLRVSLFGDFPTSSSSPRGPCTIQSPSRANVRSIRDANSAMRFDRFTFRSQLPSVEGLASPSPSKKPRLDGGTSLEDRWEAAVQSMEKASVLERDGLPSLISSYASIGGSFYDSLDGSDPDTSNLRSTALPPKSRSTQKLKSQRSKANLKSTPRDDSKSWTPCPPDPTLQIPGELVLARAPGAGASLYWPGQIIAHVPNRKERYRIKFLDDEEYVVGRDKFFTAEEEGFVSCTLGQWESAVKTTDDPESDDEDEPENGNQDVVPGPPPPPEDFENLSVQAQLAYVKPVLRAILAKGYAPALARHDAFMKGGNARVGVLKSAGIRGGMDTRFIKKIQRAICRWVLGKSHGSAQKPQAEPNGTTEDSAVNRMETSLHDEEIAKVPESDKMQEIEGATVSDDNASDSINGGAPMVIPSASTDNDAESSSMAVDKPMQPSDNGATDGPVPMQIIGPPDSPAVPSAQSLPEFPQPPLSALLPEDQAQHSSPQIGCKEFEALSGVEKLDYCLNILLPESIQQLLLWRSGERTSVELLAEAEEQRLHGVGTQKANETDWVDDVMRLRAAQARLWGVDLDKPPQEEKIISGGTRSRPRRTTVSK